MIVKLLVTQLYLPLSNPTETIARQAPLFMGFPRQEYWSELLFPSLGDLSKPGIEPRSPELQADYSPFKPPGDKSQYAILIFLSDFALSFGNLF